MSNGQSQADARRYLKRRRGRTMQLKLMLICYFVLNRSKADVIHDYACRFQPERTNSSAIVDSLVSATSPAQIGMLTFLRNLKDSGWDNVVFFAHKDSRSPTVRNILQLIQACSMYVIHYTLTSSINETSNIQNIIHELYDRNKMTNFFWFIHEPIEQIPIVEMVFKSQRPTSLMTNRIKVVLLCPQEKRVKLPIHFREAVLDNLVWIYTDAELRVVDGLYTLRWLTNARRQFEPVINFNMKEEKTVHHLFPNMRNGLNGRTVTAITKEWLYDVYKILDPVTGKQKYVGLSIDVINMLALALNFTVVYIPEPGKDDEIGWNEYNQMVANAEVDFGAALYATHTELSLNHSVSFPVLYGTMAGVYVSHDSGVQSPLLTLFRKEVYITILSVLSILVAMYQIIDRLHTKYQASYLFAETDSDMDVKTEVQSGFSYFKSVNLTMPNKDTNEISEKKITTKVDLSNTLERGTHKGNQINTSSKSSEPTPDNCNLSLFRLPMLTTDLFFRFVGSVFSQSTLPNPPHMSARILLWSWCLMIIILSATYTGNLTADLVGQTDQIPFTNFEELIKSGDYRWGMNKDLSFYGVMEQSEKGTILRRLFDGIQEFLKDDPTILGNTAALISKVKSEKFVSLSFNYDIYFVGNREEGENIKFIQENLLPTPVGFTFAKTSDMKDLFSEYLLRAYDHGQLQKLIEKNNLTSGDEQNSDDGGTLGLEYMSSAFYACGFGALAALIMLVIEILGRRLKIIQHLLEAR